MKQLLKELKKLNFPSDQYAIFGSGPMGIRGLKEINDLDVVVSGGLYEKLKNKFKEEKPGQIKIGNVEIFPCWNALIEKPEEVIKRAENIHGFKFITLPDLIQWKSKMGREKDKKDIEIIEEFLNGENTRS